MPDCQHRRLESPRASCYDADRSGHAESAPKKRKRWAPCGVAGFRGGGTWTRQHAHDPRVMGHRLPHHETTVAFPRDGQTLRDREALLEVTAMQQSATHETMESRLGLEKRAPARVQA